MPKTSRYHNSSYIVSFGNDVIYLDLVVHITRTGHPDGRETFVGDIQQCQINRAEMEFAGFIIDMLDAAGLEKLYAALRTKVLEELDDNLFNYFYVGTILNEAPQA